MKLYQFAVFYVPEKKSDEKAVIVVEPKTILAADEKSAMLQAARSIPEDYFEKMDRLEVAVRPF